MSAATLVQYVVVTIRPPPIPPLFPFTALFRSHEIVDTREGHRLGRAPGGGREGQAGRGDRPFGRVAGGEPDRYGGRGRREEGHGERGCPVLCGRGRAGRGRARLSGRTVVGVGC